MKLLTLFSDAQLADLASQTRKEILKHEANLAILKSRLVRAQCIDDHRKATEKLTTIQREQKDRMLVATLAT